MKYKGFTLVEVLVVIAIISILFMIVFAGCQMYYNSKVTEGTVIERKFIPEHVESHTDSYYIDEDIPRIPITTYHTVPDQYIIWIEGQYDGKVRTRRLLVDRISYQMLRIGDHLKVSDLPLIPTAEMNYETNK